MITFEESLPIIDVEIEKRRGKWTLTGVPYFGFDDAAQIIRAHIYRKWYLYKQSEPLLPWVNTVISNQIRNIIRNLYGNHARPCLKCPANEGNDLCMIFGKQCSDCWLYRKWLKKKKPAHDIKLPVTIENHTQEVYSLSSDNFDVEAAAKQLHVKMKNILNPLEWKIYQHLYIDFGEESDIAKKLGYRTTEKGRISGYKTIFTIKKSIIEKVKAVLKEDGV